MYYDTIYKDNPNFCGARPNKLLLKIVKQFKDGRNFLDLGCGQGRDSFFMAKNGFNVTAVDNSKVGINQIKNLSDQNKIKNIHAICQSIKTFPIERNKFNIINCFNSLQFLYKNDSLKTIALIKKNLAPKGIVIIASFTSDNPTSKRRKSHFEIGELKALFPESKYDILHYYEGLMKDSGHAGQPEPHKHGVVEIIVQKK